MFYDQLRKACKRNGTSVTATLKEIGIGGANGTYWKNGSIPSSDIVVKLAEFLDVTTDYLLTGKETPSANEGLKPEERQFIEKFNKLEPIDQGKILERMDVIYENYPPAAVQEPQDGFSEPAEPTAASLDQKKHLA
ncbi:MAG: helix-turn-helix domain-containing protein [Oscillospiraceae bacterium]|nr:helix-turn-helix domain-containing protein [Oscillospiraceae bacterium]